MKRQATLFLVAITFLFGAALARGDVPRLVNYQGVLKDTTEQYLEGDFDLTFRIYPTPGPGAGPLWTELQPAVPVGGGVFNVLLGSVSSFPEGLFDNPDLWLSIQVEQDIELDPRQRLSSVPWAMHALVADSALTAPGGSGGADGDWTINLPHMYAAVPGSLGVGTNALRGKLSVRNEIGTALHAFSSDGSGVFGSGTQYGLRGSGALNQDSRGVYGFDPTTDNSGYLASQTAGAYGEYAYSGNHGMLGTMSHGAYGQYMAGNFGYLGGASYGVYGERASNGNSGSLGASSSGARGDAGSLSSYGVSGYNIHGGIAVRGFATSGSGVEGVNSGAGTYGYLGRYDSGVYGQGDNEPGVKGQSASGYGVYGLSTSGAGVFGASASGHAGRFDGDLLVENGQVITPMILITGGADFSEPFAISGEASGVEPAPGLLVSVDAERPGQLIVSRGAYDKRVAGVISGAGGVNPGIVMGQWGTAADGQSPVALSGRVYCWADADACGPIEPGDMLTTSDLPGHAMKAGDPSRSHGAVIGKAMTGLASGRGLVLVLVNLQ